MLPLHQSPVVDPARAEDSAAGVLPRVRQACMSSWRAG